MSTSADVFSKARIHDRMEQLKTLRGLGALPFFRVLEGATQPVVEMEGRSADHARVQQLSGSDLR